MEVIEKGYKGFFIYIWYENSLINFYDKYCYEKAYEQKNFDYLHKAKLEFYLEYGTNEDYKAKIRELLSKKHLNLNEIKELANSYMPNLSTVLNVEYETKRRFYLLSDDLIESLKTRKENNTPLSRLFKIIDNKKLFLDHLTKSIVSFNNAWFKRLQNTKLYSLKTDKKLERNYSIELDERSIKMRSINLMATNSIYNEMFNTNLDEDFSEFISNLNDNDKFEYKRKKELKYHKLKNRLPSRNKVL